MSAEQLLGTTLRSQMGGALRLAHVGSKVKLGGWVQRQRAMGGIVFLDLRDRAGVVQVSFDPTFADAEAIKLAGSVGRESVVLIEGEVVARPENGRNAELETGDVEVKATSMRVVGPAETPAIPVVLGKGETLPSEELRLRHRYLDLRRPDLQTNIVLRHRLMQATRTHLQRARLPRDRNADSDQADAGGRARLSGAEQGERRGVLRAAAVAAALQAAAHDLRLRSLLPDRALLPRRGSACGPAARVHADRHRSLVHHGRGHLLARRGVDCGALERRRFHDSRPRSRA